MRFGTKKPRQICHFFLWHAPYNSVRVWITEPKQQRVLFSRTDACEFNFWFFGLYVGLLLQSMPWHKNPRTDSSMGVFRRAEAWRKKQAMKYRNHETKL